ncbi:MAG: hypothetical protein AB1646_02755 [Thermodesulfobacteriota bacterium]
MQKKKWILDKDRPKSAVTIEMPADVVADLEQVAASKGMTGHHELIRYYVGRALKEDLDLLRAGEASRKTETDTTRLDDTYEAGNSW